MMASMRVIVILCVLVCIVCADIGTNKGGKLKIKKTKVVKKVIKKVGDDGMKSIKRVNKKTNYIIKQSDKILSALDELAAKIDQCNVGLKNAHYAIEHMPSHVTYDEHTTDNPEKYHTSIDLCDKNDVDVQLSVKVPGDYEECMSFWNYDASNDAEKALCLRYVLWGYHPGQNTQPDDPNNNHTGPGMGLPVPPPSGSTPICQNFNIEQYCGVNNKPQTGHRIRKEYRALTVNERNRFHAALNEMYQSGLITCFADLHDKSMLEAHNGPAFLGWHRGFISCFEEALRSFDKTVSIPYWNSNFENNLIYSMQISGVASGLWSDSQMGTRAGKVISGPSAFWRHPTGGVLERMVGEKGETISDKQIEDTINVDPCTFQQFWPRLEGLHNNVHNHIGGTMVTGIAPMDPMFYLHHASIDRLWEIFRKRQRNDCNVVPSMDYPVDAMVDKPSHYRNAPMGNMPFWKNIDGSADWWIRDWFSYEDAPSCQNDCGKTGELYCSMDGLCIPYTRLPKVENITEIKYVANEYESEVKSTIDNACLNQVKKDILPGQYNVTDGNKYCDVMPYFSYCPHKPPPDLRTVYDLAGQMVRKEIPYTKNVKAIKDLLDYEKQWCLKNPPINVPSVFKADPCENPDAKKEDTLIYDLLTAKERGCNIDPPSQYRPLTPPPQYTSNTPPSYINTPQYPINAKPSYVTKPPTYVTYPPKNKTPPPQPPHYNNYTTTPHPPNTPPPHTQYTTPPYTTTPSYPKYPTPPTPPHPKYQTTSYPPNPPPHTQYTPPPFTTTPSYPKYPTPPPPPHPKYPTTPYPPNTSPPYIKHTPPPYTTTPSYPKYPTPPPPPHPKYPTTPYPPNPPPPHTQYTPQPYTTTPSYPKYPTPSPPPHPNYPTTHNPPNTSPPYVKHTPPPYKTTPSYPKYPTQPTPPHPKYPTIHYPPNTPPPYIKDTPPPYTTTPSYPKYPTHPIPHPKYPTIPYPPNTPSPQTKYTPPPYATTPSYPKYPTHPTPPHPNYPTSPYPPNPPPPPHTQYIPPPYTTTPSNPTYPTPQTPPHPKYPTSPYPPNPPPSHTNYNPRPYATRPPKVPVYGPPFQPGYP